MTNAAQVRGVLAEKVIVSTVLDPFLSLTALARYCGLSKGKLRELIDAPVHPLPAYQVGIRGKILVRRSEFDAWFQGAADDIDMKTKLLQELPGILNWALAGAKDCLVSGLNPPREVIETRDEYRRDEDRLRLFFDDCCRLGPDETVLSADITREYKAWCEREGEKAMGGNEFASELKSRGLVHIRVGHKQSRGWRGIGLQLADSRQPQTAKNEPSNSPPRVEDRRPGAVEIIGENSEVLKPPSAGVCRLQDPTETAYQRELDPSFNCYAWKQADAKRQQEMLLHGMLGALSGPKPKPITGCTFKDCPVHSTPTDPWQVGTAEGLLLRLRDAGYHPMIALDPVTGLETIGTTPGDPKVTPAMVTAVSKHQDRLRELLRAEKAKP